jgi:urea transporter
VRYLFAVVGILFVVGLALDVAPFGVLAMWAVLALLVISSIIGARRGNRERALHRAVFLNDSLIGFKESVEDDHKRRSEP